VVSDVGDEIL
jgi:hypothetical protein